MNEEEKIYALALQQTKGVGAVRAKKLIREYGSATLFFQEYKSSKVLQSKFQLFTNASLIYAEKELLRVSSKRFKVYYFLEDDYPSLLNNCADAPLLLFYDGTKDLGSYKRMLSVVGTRNMTNYGKDLCEQLIADLKQYNPLIVSGFAYGVDICAHTSALKEGLGTLAVLAHGYGTLYPKAHKPYYTKVQESGGFLTEFLWDESPLRENFLKRNRIVAGISQATVVIESAQRGGALVTADIANSYNRDVFCVPGKTTDTYSKGCLNLIKNNKAALITSAEDIVFSLGWKKQKIEPVAQPTLFLDLQGDEQLVFDNLVEPIHIDVLARACKMPVYKLSTVLFHLEMKGLVKTLPGKVFAKR